MSNNHITSVQERLQLKRVPLDKWSTKEKLCLASAVACSGDQNWMSVSRALKMLCGTNRPADWFSQKSCAAQYGKLLENVETPKRKKRTASEREGVSAVETPGESILRKLTQERVIELKKIIQEEAQQYTKVKEDIILIQSGVTDEKKLREMWKQIEMEKAQKEKEQILHAQWLKEREEKKLELERQWRPLFPNSPNPAKGTGLTPGAIIKIKEDTDDDSQSSCKSGTSPLLTSLLKSPTANPSNSPNLTGSSGKAASSPTITNLLTGGNSALMTIQGKNLFPSPTKNTPALSQQLSDASPSSSKLQDVGSLPEESVPKRANDILSQGEQQAGPIASISSQSKEEEMEIDTDNVDPAKDLMAVFQELMPEELDEILNEDNAMILEDEILENVVDSIMEEAESMKDKINVLSDETLTESVVEPASSATIGQEEQSNPDRTGSKNEETIPENAKGIYLKSVETTSLSPKRQSDSVDSEQQSIQNEDIIQPKEDEGEKAFSDGSDKPDATQEGESSLQSLVDRVEDSKECEVIRIEGSSSNSPITNLPTEENKTVEENLVVMSDLIKEDDSPCDLKTETETETEDSEDKPLAHLETTPTDAHKREFKTEDDMDEKRENAEVPVDESSNSSHIIESKSKEEIDSNISEAEAARAKKEAFEKLAAEYDFKDEEEPIVPLSIQKSKEEKHVPEEDVSMEVQANFEEPVEQKDSVQKHPEESIAIAITDTDDDSLIEMKISKTKRDYSRRRPTEETAKSKEDSSQVLKSEENEGRSLRKLRDRDRSESPFVLLDDDVSDKMKRSYSSTPVIDSIPSSPVSSEDREYRTWKKSILNVHSKICSLRYASGFTKPLPEEHISELIYRPMDLSIIKKNIENGTIRSTAEYQRELMLICTNAVMLNRVDICSPTAARVLLNESTTLIEASLQDVITRQHQQLLPAVIKPAVSTPMREKEIETRSTPAVLTVPTATAGSSVNKRSSRSSKSTNTRSSTSGSRI
ncbi:bromodomain-containing protein 8 [Uranotaenia lowii]|uniref:bromodomain-containing protein 8 n=1 Tax=Uranotaenia lowii TaxID=190385 RepID=UPI0024788FFD|nr:bromodomain-containing protein 8 [Uranotaenia lowii]XP_055614224.1 bromodomain-containing protein 8 [Uranotaenia lowii]